jgi:hypothetical protein
MKKRLKNAIIIHPEVDYYDSSDDYLESVELDYPPSATYTTTCNVKVN